MLEKRLVSLAAALIVLLGSDSLAFAATGVTGCRIFSYNPNPVTSAMGVLRWFQEMPLRQS
ncbi:MAG: hypothetical protein LBD98_01945 [Endomicrobium sp.]|jgi:hypothetical protein|nr:hypothetical protein [Endomicrobium sp.]